MASVSPSWTEKLTPCTARARPLRVRNSTCRSVTCSSGAVGSWLARASISTFMSVATATSPQPRVEGVAEGVAEKDEREHRADQEDAREDQQQRELDEVRLILGDHDAPRGLWRHQANAKEGHRRLGRHERAEGDGP